MASRRENQRREIHPLGVAERLADAPPSRYQYRGAGKPDGGRTYVLTGVEHRFDGECHETCEDVR